jgi:hypothetical protein
MVSHEQRSNKGIESVRDAKRLTKCDALYSRLTYDVRHHDNP